MEARGTDLSALAARQARDIQSGGHPGGNLGTAAQAAERHRGHTRRLDSRQARRSDVVPPILALMAVKKKVTLYVDGDVMRAARVRAARD